MDEKRTEFETRSKSGTEVLDQHCHSHFLHLGVDGAGRLLLGLSLDMMPEYGHSKLKEGINQGKYGLGLD